MDNDVKKVLKRERGIDVIEVNEKKGFNFTCQACGKCCMNRHNEDTILVFPRDVFQIIKHAKGLDRSDEDAVVQYMVDKFGFYIGSSSGLPLCYLKEDILSGSTTKCVFLKQEGDCFRCEIHDHKPSVCRLYPLGRITCLSEEGNDLQIQYFLQSQTCNTGKQGLKLKRHSLDEWIPDRKEAEEAFKTFSDFTGRLNKVIDLKLLNTSENLQGNFKIAVNKFHNSYIEAMYSNYDYEQDFFQQFKKRADDFVEFATYAASLIAEVEPKIIPEK